MHRETYQVPFALENQNMCKSEENRGFMIKESLGVKCIKGENKGAKK